MKVGIYIGANDPATGGGYTFLESIVSELCALASCRHTFTLFSYSHELLHHFSPYPSFITTCLLEFPQYNPSFFEKILNRIRTPKLSFPSQLPLKAKENKIQFMWLLTFSDALDVPYMCNVLDLQHRIQPFFPEVSHNGEWDMREKKLNTLLRRATFILAGTKAGQSEISFLFNIPVERIKILRHPTPNFVLSDIKPDLKVFEKTGFEQNYLFYPAQFWAHKNHLVILLALQELKKRNVMMNAVFTGSDKGNMKHIQNKIKEFGLEEQIKILGFVSREELIALYKNALALVYATYFGPENLPPLEAFALGCPVIASSVSGSEEQMEDCAITFHPMNHHELAEKIALLLYQPTLRKNLAEKGRERALRYTTKHYTTDLLALLDSFESMRETWE